MPGARPHRPSSPHHPRHPRQARRRLPGLRLAAAFVVSLSAFAGFASAPAGAQTGAGERITAFASHVTIRADGTLHVVEEIHYDFGGSEHHGIFRDIPMRFDYPPRADTDRVTPIRIRSVTASGGASGAYETSELTENGVGFLHVRIGDANRLVSGAHTYTINYDVRGALNGFRDHVELVWNITGSGWSVPIDRVTAVVDAPAAVLQVNCSSGPYGATLPCDAGDASSRTASFAQSSLGPFSGITVAIAIPTGVVPKPVPILEDRWTFGRAFAVNPATVAGTLVVAALLGVGVWCWFVRPGRDRRYRGSAVDQVFAPAGSAEERVPLHERTETPVEFVPPDGLLPGEIGVLVDFTAQPLDVTATIVDLAVRKYLTIGEIDDAKGHADDWQLTRLAPPAADAAHPPRDYERLLLDALFRDGESVKLSDLRLHFAGPMRTVQQALVDRAMGAKWFTHKPGTVRAVAALVGMVVLIGGVVLTIALAAATHAGLVGIPVIGAGIVVAAGARSAPARTATGYAVWRRAEGFRRFILESEQERARFAERAHLFSEYLPYAIVFGATQQWARAFAGLGAEPPDTSGWYLASRPFEVLAFTSAISQFTVVTAGTLTAVPASASGASGFGGGGFSGGGFGGGGGGSW